MARNQIAVTGPKSKVSPKEEREESKTSDGIAETVVPGSRYRFLNLGNEEAEPKREHQALFAEIQKTYLSAHPDVGCRFVGHASSPGTDAFNMALSLKRAQAFYQMARDAGAKQVYFASAAPPVRFPNVYGIDMPAAAELVAHGRTEDEVQQFIGADWLVYQDLDDLIAAVAEGNEELKHFDTSCFSGEYVTGVETNYLRDLEFARSDETLAQRRHIS